MLYLFNFVSPSDINAEAGIQKGMNKIFLRQYAFDNIEKLRSKVLTVSAVKIHSVARRFIFRCRFIDTMRRVVIGQAGARRFLARKYLKAFCQRRAAIRIQTIRRSSVARRRFVAMKDASVLLQSVYRGYIARKNYKVLYERTMEELKLNNSAIVIQCMFRIVVAGKKYVEVKSIQRRPSKTAPKLEGKALKAAIASDKAAAMARQTAKQRAKEVDNLTLKLGDANHSAANARLTLEDLKTVRAELAAALAELEVVKEEAVAATKRAEMLEEENAELKETLESGVFIAGEPYSSKMYSGYPDLEELDKQMFMMTAQSKKSKDDLKALLGSFSILK